MTGRSILAAALTTLASAAWAQPQVPPDMGLLQDVLVIGTPEGSAWTGTVDDGYYVLVNRSDPNAVHFAHADGSALPDRLRVSVEVQVSAGDVTADDAPVAGAGLLYGFRTQPFSYHALLLSADGTVRLLQHDEAGLRELASIALEHFDSAAPHQLRVVEYIGEITAVVDGRETIDLQIDAVGAGTVGIVAFGTGRFAFRDFSVTAVPGLYVSTQPIAHSRDGRK